MGQIEEREPASLRGDDSRLNQALGYQMVLRRIPVLWVEFEPTVTVSDAGQRVVGDVGKEKGRRGFVGWVFASLPVSYIRGEIPRARLVIVVGVSG